MLSCICQGFVLTPREYRDDVEKTIQIQLMGEIYQQARLVVVWLGDMTEKQAAGLQGLEDVAAFRKPMPPGPMDVLMMRKERPTTSSAHSRAEIEQFADMVTTAIHLIMRPWFRRVWVVQELCLARKAVYLHGQHEITPEALLTAWKWMLAAKTNSTIQSGETAHEQVAWASLFGSQMQFLPASIASQAGFSSGKKGTLLDWLQVCMGRQASEAKDYVFAGLSLVREDLLTIDQSLQPVVAWPAPPPQSGAGGSGDGSRHIRHEDRDSLPGILPRGLWPRLAPNYAVTDAEVLANAAACLLTHKPVEALFTLAFRVPQGYGLSTLLFGAHQDIFKALEKLPSWIPPLGSWKVRHGSPFPHSAKPAGC